MPGTSIAVAHPGAALRQFAAGLRRRYALGRGLGALVRWSLLLAVPAVPLLWLLPALRDEVLLVGALVVVPVAVLEAANGYWRGRRILALLRSSLGEAGDLGPLPDELQTWFELAAERHSPAARTAMLRWLERDVADRLVPHRHRALAAVGRPRLGRFRWLVPLLLLLVLLWLVASFWQPPWTGAVGGAPNQPTPGDVNGAGGEPGGDAESEPGDGEPEQGEPKQGEPEQPDDAQPEPSRPDVPAGPEREPPAPDEPVPLVDRPDDQRFVLPEFIGDGPTRRERMHAAELVQEVGSAAPSPSSLGARATAEAPPPRPQVDFVRAAERALRARHVPKAERPIVRRFFEQLQRRARERSGSRGR